MVRSKQIAKAGTDQASSVGAKSSRTILIISALDMSWRLAFAVLVPIIGGFELDKHLNTTPLLTIIGFVLAMAGLFYILKRTLNIADKKFKTRTQR